MSLTLMVGMTLYPLISDLLLTSPTEPQRGDGLVDHFHRSGFGIEFDLHFHLSPAPRLRFETLGGLAPKLDLGMKSHPPILISPWR
jgi:hypothetical protein